MRRIVLAIIILGSFAAGVAYYANSAGRGEFTYLTAPVERGDLVIMVTATGTLNAVVTVQVGSQLSGQIAELLADFNDEVRSGQPIARLDPQTFEAMVREAAAELDVARADIATEAAAVDKASADLAIARNERAVREAQAASARALYEEAVRALERKRALLERTTISQSEFESAQSVRDSAVALLRAAEAQIEVQDATILAARAARQMAEARLESARAEVKRRGAVLDRVQVDLARATIRSPIDGVVIKRAVDRGQTVAASLEAPELFTIAQDLRQMEVHARIDEADIGQIQVGQRATFTVDAYPGRSFAGEVLQIRKAHEVVQNVVTYRVLVSADNLDLALLPGMTALVQVVVAETTGVLKVPNAALRFRPPEGSAARAPDTATALGAEAGGTPTLVWTLGADGLPSPLHIGTGVSDLSATEIVSGPLSEGQELVVGATSAAQGSSFFGLRLGF